MKKLCKYCGKEFYVSDKNKKALKKQCCSKKCAALYKWKNDVAFKEKHSKSCSVSAKKIQKEVQNRPDMKLLRSEIAKKNWENPEYANKVLTNGRSYKEYILPSGHTVKLQGYEPHVLNDLLKTYSESDIICEVKNINKEIGLIKYFFNNKICTYYPDFYIKSTNTIIEVKSEFSFNYAKEKNLAKEQACLKQGFNFLFIILP